MRHLYKSLTLVFAVTVLGACVTQRKKDEAKGFKLFMHNLTSKYNGYFNANVLVQEATDKLNEQHQDNYNQVLDVYPYLAVDNPAAVAPDLDKAIEKVAVVATYHRPSHWVDDCYLMMGKAQYLKHDFDSAEETFAYLAENYNPSLKKKMTSKQRAQAAAEVREEKKKEREQKAKDTKKAREQAVKDKEKEKEARNKQAEKDKEEREKALKNAKEEEAKQRKEAIKDKKLSLEERNELKRKENAERTEQRRKERLAKQGIKVDKTKPTDGDNTPSVTVKPDDKKDAPKVVDNTKSTKKDKEEDSKPKAEKPKAKPDKYFLRHRPCYQEGVVWYARTLVERQNYVDAEVLLDEIDKNPKTFKDIRALSAVARAALHLKQKQYDKAIPALERGIALSKKKKEKARLAYILAQLYQIQGNSEKAYASFDKVLDFNPVYEMEFNSRLNKALNDSKAGDQTTATLVKMSKDFKNREYGDQIYFTLAQIALKKGDKPLTISYLQQALASPGRGQSSKGEAFYLMAKLQYEAESFVAAKNYYDSASTTLAKTDIRRNESERYATNLMEIARNIELINMQDSLLKISTLSDKDKRELAIRIKKDRIKKAQALANPSVPGGTGAKLSDFDLADAAKKSKFWGYNAELVKKGKREFEKRWSTDRKLEDNWRRSNKRSNGDFVKNNDAEIASSDMTAKEYQDIMKDVPKTPKDVEAAQGKIEEALFMLGTLYHDKLKNDNKAIAALENQLLRFPQTKHELDDWYYLHLAHTDLGNKAKAQEYYDKILAKYPNTTYGLLLRDKDKQKAKDDTETVEKYYSTTYNLFKDGKYKEAQTRIKESDTKYGLSNALKPKFALLDAMCAGHELGRINYIASLKDVVNKYPGTPEEKRAQEIIRILEFGLPITESPKNATNADDNDGDPMKRFVISDDKLHYVIIILNKNADLEEAKIVVTDFDSKYNRTDALNVSSMFFSTESETPVVVVRKFKDKTAALKYTEGVAKNSGDFLKGVYEVFAISQDNYREVIRQRSVDAYRKFYEINYR